MSEAVRIHATVTGRVQMVGFRDFVTRRAGGLDLRGTVANRADGSVECVAEGPREAVERLLDALKQGPRSARVDSVDVVEESARGDLPLFRVSA
jgi:acylphosphatase